MSLIFKDDYMYSSKMPVIFRENIHQLWFKQKQHVLFELWYDFSENIVKNKKQQKKSFKVTNMLLI